MSLITVKICKGRSCSERYSEFIEKRLTADKEFYHYTDDEVSIESCLCQGRCKEGPVVLFGNDVQTGHNPVKASEMLRKKLEETRKRFANKKNA